MSIKYNGKTVAGRYKGQVVTNATKTQKGIIRVATDEEINAGVGTNIAVTPEHLSKKVDKVEGKSLISDTEIERLSKVDNYDDTDVKLNLENLNTTTQQLSIDIDKKQNKLIAGEDVVFKENEDGTVTIDINATEVLTDDVTIIQNDENIITAIGTQTKSDTILYDWVGTSEEYDEAISSGVITHNTRCLVTDDEQSIVLKADLDVPTKLSELANDSGFTTVVDLEETKLELNNIIDEKIGALDYVHNSGDEYIEGQKTFNTNVNINGITGGKITFNNTTDDTKSYIKIKNDGITFSENNTVENEKFLLTEDNIVAGENVNITKDGKNFVINSTGGTGGTNVLVDDETIVKNEEDIITTVGMCTKSNTTMYDWIGTLDEYEQAYNSGYIQPNWVCWILDDNEVYRSGYDANVALLDIIFTNQILEGREKVGKELQGSLILKSIYPDAYEKLIKFKQTSTSVEEIINGITIQYKQCTNGWKILDISNKSIYDALFEQTGSANFFVLDEKNEQFYLPKTINIYQPTTDDSKLNNFNEAILPAITTNTKTTTTTSIKVTVPNTGWTASGSATLGTVTKGTLIVGSGNAEKSEGLESMNATTASRSATVTQGATSTSTSTSSYNDKNIQPKTNNVFIYYKVADTIQTNAKQIEDIQLNIPYSLFEYKYSEIELNNISWLKSDGIFKSGKYYISVYENLQYEYNSEIAVGTILPNGYTKKGLSVKLNTEEYTDYDFVLNRENETFRLPIKTKNAPFTVSGAKTTLSMGAVSIKGNGKSLGLTDGTLTGGMTANNNYAAYGVFQKGAYNVNVGTAVTPGTSNDWTNNNKSIGVTTDASKSGLTGSVSGTATTTVSTSENTNVSLYFYVGETITNANLINADRIEEEVNIVREEKVDKSSIYYDASTSTLYIGA